MGRQIRFYLDNEKQKELLDYIYDRDLIILYQPVNAIEYYDKNNRKYDFNRAVHLYKEEWGKLAINYFFENDIILEEAELTKIKKYKDCEKVYTNDDYSPIIEFWFTGIHNNDKCITNGRFWYERTYYNEQGKLMYKNEEVNKEYNHLAYWIRKNVPKRDYIITDRYVYKEYITDDLWEKVVNKGYELMLLMIK